MVKLTHNTEKCPKEFVSKACQVYNAEFLGRFFYSKEIELPVYFFYCKTPPEGCSNYFALHFDGRAFKISNGSQLSGRRINVLKVENEYYYSSDRHDFVSVGNRFIDGGEVYVRTNSPENLVTLVMKDGEWHES